MTPIGRRTRGHFDCVVLGGGITGAGVARDAAIRGLRTLLIDSNDFASGTSHVTSKVIHGGLRYLEHGHFRLVLEGIAERDRLLNRIAPNLVRPLKFVMPFEPHRMPKWLLTLSGVELYGFIERLRTGRRSSSMSAMRLARDYPALRPHPFGVSFWDAQADDARLVMAALRAAHAGGAELRNYVQLTSARFDGDSWTLLLSDVLSDHQDTVQAKVMVNATGPWSPITSNLLGADPLDLMWIKGSHILFHRSAKFGRDAVIIRSGRDQRPLWVIPWEKRIIVGTTESKYSGDLRDIRASGEEVDDLFSSFLRYFPSLIRSREDIVGAYAGVRPIVRQAKESENELSRRHQIIINRDHRLISITGGKLTTFRKMAEESMDQVCSMLQRPRDSAEVRHRLRNEMLWPGLAPRQAGKLSDDLRQRHRHSRRESASVDRLVQLYGGDARMILERIRSEASTADAVEEGLPYCPAELIYLCRAEQVRTLLDLAKRRTSIYFHAAGGGVEALSRVGDALAKELGWDAARLRAELAALEREFQADCAALRGGATHESAIPLHGVAV